MYVFSRGTLFQVKRQNARTAWSVGCAVRAAAVSVGRGGMTKHHPTFPKVSPMAGISSGKRPGTKIPSPKKELYK